MNQLVMGWAYAWTVDLSPLDLGVSQESPMIELYEGVPGSGKSYHAICEKFLPWVRHRADGSISRSMASIWIGWHCLLESV
jgi:hypothetical protein